jgi:glycosyltransferase involved in cell wall biosynthesis
MREDKIGISLIIPVYNESVNIVKSVYDGLNMLAKLSEDYEIIIVESGSTDNTAEVADWLSSDNNQVKVIHQGAKLGLGSALKEGINKSKYEFIFYIDGDSPFSMDEFIRGFHLLRDNEVVCGYRLNRQDTFVRSLCSKAFNLSMRILYGVSIRDVQIGFKMFRKEIFDKAKLVSDSMFISAEIIAKAHKAGYRIAELGVRYNDRTSGKSSVTIREVIKIGADLIALKIGVLR